MAQLVRSRLSGISCTKCDSSIPVGVDRYVSGKMHHCFVCPPKAKAINSDNDELTRLTKEWLEI